MAKFNASSGNHRFHPGTVKVVDQNGDYRIDAKDFVILGTPRPKWNGGITNTFTYKGLVIEFIHVFTMGSNLFWRISQFLWWNFPMVELKTMYGHGTNQTGRWPMPNASGNC